MASSLDDLLADLDAVRRRLRTAEQQERRALQRRLALQAEEQALVGLLAYRRAISDEPLLDRVVGEIKWAWSDTAHAAARIGGSGGTQRVARSPSSGEAATRGANSDEVTPHAGTSRQPPTAALITALMLDRPEHTTWTPRELHPELVREGAVISKNLLRVTLRRMAERGDLKLAKNGRYGLSAQSRRLAHRDAGGVSSGVSGRAEDMEDA